MHRTLTADPATFRDAIERLETAITEDDPALQALLDTLWGRCLWPERGDGFLPSRERYQVVRELYVAGLLAKSRGAGKQDHGVVRHLCTRLGIERRTARGLVERIARQGAFPPAASKSAIDPRQLTLAMD